jgi:hypothetical protein
MAVTLTIQNSINFVRPILKMQPLDVTGMEPGLTAGNIILETMLSPPFRWRFNRGSLTFATTAAVTDYVVAVCNLGFIETQWLTDTSGSVYELNGAVSLPVVGDSSRPMQISPQYDDNQGNITFRLKNAPDAVYNVFIDYQKKAPRLGSFADSWGDVPDEFAYIYNLGFLAMTSLLINDARFPLFEQWCVARLLSAQDGLTEQEKLIWVGNWTALMGTLNRASGAAQAGIAGRSK